MMTTALKELYAFLDTMAGRQRGQGHRRVHDANTAASPSSSGRRRARSRSPRRSIRTSPNYMHWYDPDVATEETRPRVPAAIPISLPPTAHGAALPAATARSTAQELANGTSCPRFGGTATRPAAHGRRLQRLEDGDDPRRRTPARRPATFYDLPALRARDRAGAGRPAGRLLQHAGVLRQLADQHQQPDARHHQPGADRRHRRARSTAPTTTAPTGTPGLDTRPRSQARAASAATRLLDPHALDLLGDLVVELPPARSIPTWTAQPGRVRVPRRGRSR